MDAATTVEKLSTLMNMAATLSSSTDLLNTLNGSVEMACRLTNAETGSLLLADPVTGILHFHVVLGQQNSSLKDLQIPAGQGIAGQVQKTASSVIVHDVQSDPRFYRTADDTTHFVTRSMIAVPLCYKGSSIGVLQTINKRDGNFDEHDLYLAEAFAALVTPAIQNARLLSDLRRSCQEVIAEFRRSRGASINPQVVDALEFYLAEN